MRCAISLDRQLEIFRELRNKLTGSVVYENNKARIPVAHVNRTGLPSGSLVRFTQPMGGGPNFFKA